MNIGGKVFETADRDKVGEGATGTSSGGKGGGQTGGGQQGGRGGSNKKG